jgi:plastocyanin
MTTMTAPEREPARAAGPVGRPIGSRRQTLGLTLAALAPAVMFLVGALTGLDAGEAMIFPVIAAVLGATAWATTRFGTWATVLGIVLTALAAFAGFWIAFGLAAPASPGDFVPAILFVLGVVLSLAGGVQALVSRRRGRFATAPTETDTRTRVVAVGLVGLAVVGSSVANLTGRTTVDAADAEGATEVEMVGFEFAEPTVTVAGGEGAALLVRNGDGFLHDLTLPDHDLGVTVIPGSEDLLDVSSLAAGSYTFYCTLHSDTAEPDAEAAGMAGTLVVE